MTNQRPVFRSHLKLLVRLGLQLLQLLLPDLAVRDLDTRLLEILKVGVKESGDQSEASNHVSLDQSEASITSLELLLPLCVLLTVVSLHLSPHPSSCSPTSRTPGRSLLWSPPLLS